jgi:hypothetical protein
VAERKYFSSATRQTVKRETRNNNKRVSSIRRRIREFGPQWREAQIQLLEAQIQRLQGKLDIYRSIEV